MLFSAALVLAVGSLLAVPEIRATEIGEHGPIKERIEDTSPAIRQGCERHHKTEGRYDRTASAFMAQARVDRSHLPALNPPRGHRFSNGLLAPLTC